MWTPASGAGYPYHFGQQSQFRNDAFPYLDTNEDGVFDQLDESYSPYWPGEEFVDWVSLCVYNIFSPIAVPQFDIPLQRNLSGFPSNQTSRNYSRVVNQMPDSYIGPFSNSIQSQLQSSLTDDVFYEKYSLKYEKPTCLFSGGGYYKGEWVVNSATEFEIKLEWLRGIENATQIFKNLKGIVLQEYQVPLNLTSLPLSTQDPKTVADFRIATTADANLLSNLTKILKMNFK
jgi:hypothetical protein